MSTVLNESALNLPDGVPVLWAARLAGITGLSRGVRGPDLFQSGLFGDWGAPLRHYLFGGSPDALSGILSRAVARGTRDRIVGAESPPFRDLTDADYEAVSRRINDSGADVVWIGLGTPKQDFVAASLRSWAPTVNVAVGAAFDFAGGTKPEAPMFLRHTGFEWVFRLASEPRRLWRRYLFGNASFFWSVARERITSRRGH